MVRETNSNSNASRQASRVTKFLTANLLLLCCILSGSYAQRFARGVFLLFLFIFIPAADVPGQTLYELYTNKQYFELRDTLKAAHNRGNLESWFYQGAVSNKFHKPRASIQYLSHFVRRTGDETPSLKIEAYELLADNYLKTYRYADAAESYATLLHKYRDRIPAGEAADYQNSLRLWRALAKAPRQTVVARSASVIKRTNRGNYPLKINNQAVAFGVDTGANLSVITKSLATGLGLQLIEASVEVVAVAGNKVIADLAIAQSIDLGNVRVRNAVFLVFADKDLYVSEAGFQIDGLVGFPIIAALREVSFVRSGEIRIPSTPTTRGDQNMCLDGLIPLIAGWYRGQRLAFALDTGANRSTLYPPFFKRYAAEIKQRHRPHVERVRGVGGFREIKAYLATDLAITFAGRQAKYDQIPILTEYTTGNSRHFYGNLGQDLVRQFEAMTLNFQRMSIIFE